MGTYRRRNCGILPRGRRQILVISWRHLIIKRHIAVLIFFRNMYQFQCWECHTGLDTNGCPLGNSKFILLSDNLNICLWLSACQFGKMNQVNNSWSTIYQQLSQPDATLQKYKHNWPEVHSLIPANLICFIYTLRKIKSDWRATLNPSMADLFYIVSIAGVLLVDQDVMPTLTM